MSNSFLTRCTSKNELAAGIWKTLMGKQFIILAIAGVGTIFGFTKAQAGGLALDAAGNPYVADSSKHSVFKYTPDGTKSSFTTELYPLGLCFDREENLFVSDGAATDAKSRRSILKFTPDGTRSTFAPGISSVGMAFDRSGNLFVSQGDSIFKFTPKGVKSTFVTSKGANFIDLAFDEAGNLFVVDQALWEASLGRSIVKITPDGAKSTFARLEVPRDLTVDATGNVYVSSNYEILKFSPDGTKNTFSSEAGEAWDLAVDRSGNVFVWNGRDAVLKFDPGGSPTTFSRDLSPDKQWEYKGAEIVKAGTAQVVLDLDQELDLYGPESEILWAPDSKRFGFNYSPLHAHHTTYKKVAFYQQRGDKWVALHQPSDALQPSQLLQPPLKDHLPKGFNPRHCAPEWDELKLRTWSDANTAILYAPCYGRSRDLKTAFLFTLRFDDAGNWKIIKTHQMSKKELEEE
jgi:DNA-binding beta-propeller fold protein YncE